MKRPTVSLPDDLARALSREEAPRNLGAVRPRHREAFEPLP